MEKIIYFDNRTARLFISQQDDDVYICSILYCEKTGDWSREAEIIWDFKLKQFIASSEKEVQAKAESWFSKNIAKKYEIK